MALPLDPELAQRLRDVSLPTLGHFLETGFAHATLRALVPHAKLVGRAVTLQLRSPDAIAVNRALARLAPGDVLVIDMRDDHAHACVGAVTATTAQCAGAAGIVIDGVATDAVELRQIGLPVFARGTSALTTKRLDDGASAFGVPVQCGGVTVAPGAIVIADDNGVLFSDAATLASVIDAALASDRAEPALLARLRAGEPAADVLCVPSHNEYSPR
ncbi:dimethylmenaquinone methyltransferase [Burkholderia ubonensis]|uniref:RraA family protein n=1 Tax=Burkholderia ubonensis TaxID=101571 RepID=UPI000754D08A|nr:RraA family protein [Burkholderia ubonensis]KWD49488.1 dimethylmenaquinone methyltransferase [Burkholderia ubonensis]KWD51605.1 dimethylmenaquinone methyltransferase [Burkholderia ubonensis]